MPRRCRCQPTKNLSPGLGDAELGSSDHWVLHGERDEDVPSGGVTVARGYSLPSTAACLWAKTGPEGRWHSLAAHLVDTTHIAERLWEEWFSRSTRRWLAEPFGGDHDAGRALFAWLAGCHDIGKASPAFQIQVAELADQVRTAGLLIPTALPERAKAPHAKVSAVVIGPLLAERFGWDRRFTIGPAAILGGHHGWFPEEGFSLEGEKRPSLYGWSTDQSASWMAARASLFDLVVGVSGAELVLRSGNVELGRARELALAGYVVLADWLASNETLFPYASSPFAPSYPEESAARAQVALGLIGWHRWEEVRTPLDFFGHFGFQPNALQREMIAAASGATEPGLFIVEAPMGVGKTEAAFAAVEVLASTHGLGGTFVALPTQATSNQMFLRVRRWLGHFERGTYLMELAHGKATQLADYSTLGGTPASVDVDEDAGAQVTAEAWFHGSKRRLLAPFVVGTVDQALLCAAKVRHVALRQVGLVGKVVVIDEVHDYDAHMSVFLRRALRWLGEARVPVILLSATLPPATRRRLIEAYVGSPVEVGDTSYPAVVHVGATGDVLSSPVTLSDPPKRARLQVLTEQGGAGSEEIADCVVALARREANVLVVRNTVLRAQETYRALIERLGDSSVALLHSRFLADHRMKKESWLAEHFGPGGHRLRGHVVVGTQVLEQSLDIDFDVLVTDLAPIDLVLQRAGRVHRHEGVHRPEGFEDPLVIVTGLSRVGTGPPTFPTGSRIIYADHLLLRTAALLLTRESITLPDEVPLLVAQAYGDDELVPSTWADRATEAARAWRDKLRAQEQRAEQLAILPPECAPNLLELCRIGIGDPDDDDPSVQSAVRDASPTVEVVAGWDAGIPDEIACIGGNVSLDHRPDPEEVDHALSSTLRLPPWLTAVALDELTVPPGWKDHPWLRHLRVLRLGQASEAAIGNNVLRYSEALGLEVTSGGGKSGSV